MREGKRRTVREWEEGRGEEGRVRKGGEQERGRSVLYVANFWLWRPGRRWFLYFFLSVSGPCRRQCVIAELGGCNLMQMSITKATTQRLLDVTTDLHISWDRTCICRNPRFDASWLVTFAQVVWGLYLHWRYFYIVGHPHKFWGSWTLPPIMLTPRLRRCQWSKAA